MSNDDWVPFSKESTDRREDPELKAKVAKVVRARQEALKEASKLLEQAAELLSVGPGFVGDEIYNRQVRSVRSASYSLKKDAEFSSGNGRPSGNPADNDTYLGNLAAAALGVQIQEMGDRFPL